MDGCDWAGVFEFNHCPDYLKADHYAGLYLLISTVLAAITIVWMHSQMGMARLLGIVHIVLWPPMIINAWKKLRNGPLAKSQTVFMAILIITCILAMVCDFYDVARWLIGQRAAIV